MRSPVNRHRLWQVAVDAGLIAAAWILSWFIRFEADARPVYYDRYLEWDVVVLVVGVMLPVFAAFGFYNRWWRYVSTRDMWGAVRGVVVGVVATYVLFTLLDFHPAGVPRGIWIVFLLLLLAFVAGSRLLARSIIERPAAGRVVARGKEVIIVGAGDAAQLILKEMLRNPALGYTPIGLVDDDPRKKNVRLHGIRVLGTSDELAHILRDRRPDELLIAIPSAAGEVRERIVEIARAERVPVKTLPGLPDLIAGDFDFDLARQIRPVEVEDLLGREPVTVDLESIAGYLTDEVVLVTGAGGSIGSELCRQIARMRPTRLVLVDNAEPALFEIERELVGERGFHATAAILADAGNKRKMRQIFEKYRPAVVFHAAAYKHVALLEANPLDAVRNNTLATRTVADVAVEFGAKRFVLVSTDKAVNPKTIMGQSKALCERIVETWGHREDTPTRFCGVRFGNVLGSTGSVIPIFRKQIARGGPVTVTHVEMTRYFMTIPEAVQLVIQAGRDRRSRPGLRARHGRAGEDRRPRGVHDPALGQGARARDRDRVHRRAARREAARGAVVGRRGGDAVRARGDRARHARARRSRLARGGAGRARRARRRGRHARARRPVEGDDGHAAPADRAAVRRRSGRRGDGARIRDRSSPTA